MLYLLVLGIIANNQSINKSFIIDDTTRVDGICLYYSMVGKLNTAVSIQKLSAQTVQTLFVPPGFIFMFNTC